MEHNEAYAISLSPLARRLILFALWPVLLCFAVAVIALGAAVVWPLLLTNLVEWDL